MEKTVTIIVPIYNAEKYLHECIDSILNQTYLNFQLILINDGSTDKSLDICSSYVQKDQRVLLVNSLNHGVAKARNIGISSATGEYICFIDSDDYVDSHFIEDMIVLAEKTSADIVECNVGLLYPNGKIVSRNLSDGECQGNLNCLLAYLKNENTANYSCNKLFRRKTALKNVEFPSLRFSEDYVFNVLALKRCNLKITTSNVLYFYRQHINSATKTIFSDAFFDQLVASDIVFEEVKDYGSNFITYSLLKKLNFIISYFTNFYEQIKNNKSTVDMLRKEYNITYTKFFKYSCFKELQVKKQIKIHLSFVNLRLFYYIKQFKKSSEKIFKKIR